MVTGHYFVLLFCTLLFLYELQLVLLFVVLLYRFQQLRLQLQFDRYFVQHPVLQAYHLRRYHRVLLYMSHSFLLLLLFLFLVVTGHYFVLLFCTLLLLYELQHVLLFVVLLYRFQQLHLQLQFDRYFVQFLVLQVYHLHKYHHERLYKNHSFLLLLLFLFLVVTAHYFVLLFCTLLFLYELQHVLLFVVL